MILVTLAALFSSASPALAQSNSAPRCKPYSLSFGLRMGVPAPVIEGSAPTTVKKDIRYFKDKIIPMINAGASTAAQIDQVWIEYLRSTEPEPIKS